MLESLDKYNATDLRIIAEICKKKADIIDHNATYEELLSNIVEIDYRKHDEYITEMRNNTTESTESTDSTESFETFEQQKIAMEMDQENNEIYRNLAKDQDRCRKYAECEIEILTKKLSTQ